MRMFLQATLIVALSLLLFSPVVEAAPVNDLVGTIQDLTDFPQDVSAYLPKSGADVPYLTTRQQEELFKSYLKEFFSPWDSDDDGELSKGWSLSITKKDRWGENLLPITQKIKDGLVQDVSMESFPAMDKKAIVVFNTSARFLPTMRPFFANPEEAGEGYPFDYLQNTALWVGVPVRARHVNGKGDWLLCRTGTIPGWVPARDVAFVDDAFIKKYRTGRYMAVVEDDVSICDEKSSFLVRTHIGAVLPICEEREETFVVYVPLRTVDGTVALCKGIVRKGDGAEMPVPFSAEGVARLASKLMGKTYGWGGMYENRDCSATVRDLVSPFGLWLPRDSGPQSKSNTYIDVEKEPWKRKLELIAEKGLPFRTIIGLRGHVGLYLGLWKGRPALLHNTWGVRLLTSDPDVTGRAILGRTVITSLRPGIERKDVAKEGLLPKVRTITFLPGFDGTEKK
ncbi:MAG: hydrolase Nlp/P60 [Dethiosulfovibrio peptidovorans]|nr:MAG: hydrolase Nlp/P60 [Dethiosulfovibrio peptidovorans]